MPVISSFYGLIIKMYFQQREHNPPHIHVLCGDFMGAVDIQTGEMLEGDLPNRALAMVREWLPQNQAALLGIWKTQEFVKLPPLR